MMIMIWTTTTITKKKEKEQKRQKKNNKNKIMFSQCNSVFCVRCKRKGRKKSYIYKGREQKSNLIV